MAGPLISFLTDFGPESSPAVCRGVMWGIAPEARILDLSHTVRKFAVRDGAFLLSRMVGYLPIGVHIAVVDPGVGTARRPIAIRSARGDTIVGPDNGLLMPAARVLGGIAAAHEITASDLFLTKVSSTFHGRDIFSPVGAHLARGEDWTRVGPELPAKQLVRLDLTSSRLDERGLSGEVIATDGPYGNLVTNISGDDFLKLGYRHGQNVHVTLGRTDMDIPFARTFSDVPLKKPLLYIDSRGHLALAVNQGSFAAAYSIEPPVTIFFPRAKK